MAAKRQHDAAPCGGYDWEAAGALLERCARVEARRTQLQEEMAAASEGGASPDSPAMRRLLKEWMALLHARSDLNVALLKEVRGAVVGA